MSAQISSGWQPSYLHVRRLSVNNNMDVVIDKDDFLKAYRSISSQLKRKFVKRPNVTDAIEAYETLGKQQLELGFSELCAACHLAAAQLEQAVSASTSNSSLRNGEYNLFLESARSYSRSQNLIPVSSCYESAISSSSDKALTWMASMEAGQAALINRDYTTSVSFFSKAFQFSVDVTEKKLSGDKLVSSLIRQGMLADALKILHTLEPDQNMQMTKLLLALNLRKHSYGEAKKCQIIHQTLEESKDFFGSELYCCVNLLIYNDDDGILKMLPTLWKYLNIDQQQLILTLCI